MAIIKRPTETTDDLLASSAQNMRDFISIVRGYIDTPDGTKKIKFATNQMSRGLNNLINLSKYNVGKLKLNINGCTFNDIYSLIQDEIQSLAKTAGQIILLDTPKKLPDIAADVSYMSEVLYNLIDNAIKFSNPGAIIQVKIWSNTDHINVTVVDHGIGMSERTIGWAFSGPDEPQKSSTGIGLHISRIITKMHGGDISISSELNKGSKFTISIPTHKRAADQSMSASKPHIINNGHGWVKRHLTKEGNDND
ncbi:MAG: HAMP domain-containing sensor histidine kinase [Candidatus Saccharibacteria bacterium]